MSLLNVFGAFHAANLNKTSMRDEMIQRDCTKDEIAAVSNKGDMKTRIIKWCEDNLDMQEWLVPDVLYKVFHECKTDLKEDIDEDFFISTYKEWSM